MRNSLNMLDCKYSRNLESYNLLCLSWAELLTDYLTLKFPKPSVDHLSILSQYAAYTAIGVTRIVTAIPSTNFNYRSISQN